MDLLKHKCYEGTVEYSEADDCLFGKVVGIRDLLSYEGQSLEELRKDFIRAVEDYLEICESEDLKVEKPFKAALNVRLGQELHRDAALAAMRENITINKLVKKAVEQYCESPRANSS